MPTTQAALDALFHPRAVAVIGASDDDTKFGYIVLNNVAGHWLQRRRLWH